MAILRSLFVNIHNLPVAVLKEAVAIREQIENLQQRLNHLLSGSGSAAPLAVSSASAEAGRRGGRRQISPEGRARIAAAARARWARERMQKAQGMSAVTAAPPRKRQLSPEARQRIADAVRRRWERQKAQSAKAGKTAKTN